MSFSNEEEIKKFFKKLLFYNAPTEKSRIKNLNNVDMFREVPFYDELNIVNTAKAFKRYAKGYSIEITKDKDGNINDLSAQLEPSKPVIKVLFSDLLIKNQRF